jgi:hypothetical protein
MSRLSRSQDVGPESWPPKNGDRFLNALLLEEVSLKN